MDSIKVCMISTFPPRKCGVGDYTSELCNALSKLDVSIDVLTYKLSNAPEFEKKSSNLAIHRILDGRDMGWNIWKKIEDLSPNRIHLQSTSFLHGRLFNTFAIFKDNTPLVTTIHDTPTSHRLFHIMPFLRVVYKKSDRIVAHSEQVREALVKFHGIEESVIAKMPHGIDIDRFNTGVSDNEFREKYDLKDKFVILFFGFLRPGKGIEYLLDAFKIALPKIENAKLVIAGDVPDTRRRYFFGLKSEEDYKEQLTKLVQKMQLDENVIFTGYVPDSEMPSCFASADIVVFPYLGGSQSGPMHRALGSGRAIIATDVGGAGELIKNEINGLLVPPKNSDALAEQIYRLYKNEDLRNMLEINAKTEGEQISWNAVAKQTKRLYEEIAYE